jgi:DNA damage-binding protein 1
LRPDILFATPDGRLGIIGELTPEATVTLDGLQRNMDKYHKGPGGVNWRT